MTKDLSHTERGLSEAGRADLDAVWAAIEQAQCPGREGPYGGYDYGHNTTFYSPEPKDGRYVVRDFRDPRSDTYGAWVHQTHNRDAHEAAFAQLTHDHIAQAAIDAALRTHILTEEQKA